MAQPDIVIVDDDPMVGELSRELLTDAGYTVTLIQDSLNAIPAIKAAPPKMVITDIMMPGITGMDICKAIKSAPALRSIKVVVVSGKSYQVEQQRAVQFGADYFLSKPYNVETFSNTIKSILDGAVSAKDIPRQAEAAPAAAETAVPQENDLSPEQIRVTIRGARGFPRTIPNSASRYGRQTACVSVETRSDLFIFDAGTGIIPLGAEIASKKRYYKDIWIFLTHFHLGHIIGLSGFQPVQDPEFSVHITGANDPEKSLKEVIQAAFYSSFTMAKQPPKAKLNIYEVLEDSYEIMDGVKLATMYANHQTSTMMYSLEHLGKKIVYAPDSEIWGDATAFQDYDERLSAFAKGADLLIHDCKYSDADYETHKREGHSGLSIVVDFAGEKAKAKSLVLAHLNPLYRDEDLDKMLADARSRIKEKGYALDCCLAEEAKNFLLK